MKLLILSITMFCTEALAQLASPSPSPVAAPAAQGQWLVDLVSHYPKLAALLVIVGGLRLTLKPFFSFLHTFFQAWGLAAWDQKAVAVEQLKPVSFLYWLLDYLGSVKVPVETKDAAAASSPEVKI